MRTNISFDTWVSSMLDEVLVSELIAQGLVEVAVE